MRRAVLVWPIILFVGAGALLPLAVLVVFSFFKVVDLDLVPAFSLESWRQLVDSSVYLTLIRRTVVSGAITAILATLVGYPLAIGIWRLPPAWKGIGLIILLTPLYTGELVRLYAWRLVLGAEGLFNSFLVWTGIIREPLKILLFSPFATHLVLLYDTLPFMVLALWVSLERVDRPLVESARDLGAGALQTFRRLILPLTAPGLAAGAFAVFALSAGDLLTPNLMGGTSGATAMSMIDSLFGTAFDWPMASVMSLALLAALLLVLAVLGAVLAGSRSVRAVIRGGGR